MNYFLFSRSDLNLPGMISLLFYRDTLSLFPQTISSIPHFSPPFSWSAWCPNGIIEGKMGGHKYPSKLAFSSMCTPLSLHIGCMALCGVCMV